MEYTEINGRKISEHALNELVDAFANHAFFLFMDQGRTGFKHAAEDIVHNLEKFATETVPSLKGRTLPSETELEAIRFCTRELTDCFITTGSNGIKDAVWRTYNFICNGLIPF